MTADSQRIPSVPREAWTDATRDVFAVYEGQEGWRNGSRSNVIHMLANHPEIAHPWLRYNRTLLMSGLLPGWVREIAILRVAHRCRCEYEWRQHVGLAKSFGLGEAHFAAIQEGPEAPLWDERDRLVLRAADQLSAHLDDETWAGLSQHFTNAEILELLFLIGSYSMLAWIFNATRVEIEDFIF